ncbi:MAG TPA: hydantoinase/oxoprolinase family protein [Gemmatimonadales bacterium]|nr:hydantoinase/oxoprolinase family protein [Gemmatimonadales bacterium]
MGWDIGGVNTKVARVVGGGAAVIATAARAFELQRAPDRLVGVLRELAAEVGAGPGEVHGVTMTAELSQLFRSKGEGVAFVLDALRAAFPDATLRVYSTAGEWLEPGAALARPLAVAAANWSATARLVARDHPDAILIDIGTTTTDIIPIVGGVVAALGATDLDRLRHGELVYTGAVRTPVESLAQALPWPDGTAIGLAAEWFATAGDVHLWRGELPPEVYAVPTADGRPATREHAAERLARAVCADRSMLDDAAIDRLAAALAEAQERRVAQAVGRVRRRHPGLGTAVVAGVGDFIAERAARRVGLTVVRMREMLGSRASSIAPAVAVACLLHASGDA